MNAIPKKLFGMVSFSSPFDSNIMEKYMTQNKHIKNKQKNIYKTKKATWKKVHAIVQIYHDPWHTDQGFTASSKCFSFQTNFSGEKRLAVMREAIQTYAGSGEFGISNTAFGFHEDDFEYFKLGEGSYGLYLRGNVNYTEFRKHYESIREKRMPGYWF